MLLLLLLVAADLFDGFGDGCSFAVVVRGEINGPVSSVAVTEFIPGEIDGPVNSVTGRRHLVGL